MNIEEIWHQYNQTRSIENRNKLVEAYLPIVKKIVNSKLFGSADMHLREEYYSCGVFGLIDAVQKFDCMKNVKFETYASIRIKGAIRDYMRKQDWLPRGVRDKQRAIEKAKEVLFEKLLREPTVIEISEETGLDVKVVNDIISKVAYADIASFEELVSKGISPKNEQNQSDLGLILVEKEMTSLLASEIEKLTDKEQLVIALYYKEELKLKEIGSVLKVSESRVSQIMKKAIGKLRKNIVEYVV